MGEGRAEVTDMTPLAHDIPVDKPPSCGRPPSTHTYPWLRNLPDPSHWPKSLQLREEDCASLEAAAQPWDPSGGTLKKSCTSTRDVNSADVSMPKEVDGNTQEGFIHFPKTLCS